MAKGINKVIIVGHLGNNPELKSLPSGMAVAKVSVATTESWKDKATGEKKEQTEWHKIVCYGKLAEIVHSYLTKGALAYFEGKLKTSKWQDKESGQDRYSTEIIADNMHILSAKKENGEQNKDFLNDDVPW